MMAREKTYQSNRADEQNDTDHPLLAKEYQRLFQNAVDQLPPQQKKIWLMAKDEGLSHEQIADRLSPGEIDRAYPRQTRPPLDPRLCEKIFIFLLPTRYHHGVFMT